MRARVAAAAALVVWLAAPTLMTASDELTAQQLVERYLEARGGAEAWRRLEALEMRGTFSVISKRAPFRLVRQRGDLFRMDYTMADSPAIKARDVEGPWMLNAWLSPEVGRVTDDPYKSQLEREALFPLLLLDYQDKGIAVELLEPGEVDGIETLRLQVTLPGGATEIWHFDTESFLEVAVDSQIYDYTQLTEPIDQRIFYDDFREVGQLLLPFWIEWEFNARLESMTVEEILVDPEIDTTEFSPPTAQTSD